jgi:PPP family 3-phenylpropionic acid transporter
VKHVWPFSFYFWQFAGVAFLAPFLVLYYQSLGFSGPQIGLLTGLSPLLMLFCAPLWVALADATRRHHLVLTLTLLAASLVELVFPYLRTFLLVLVVNTLFCLFYAPITSLADSAAMRLLAGSRGMYGRLRLGGTLGYALAAPVAGHLVQSYGLRAAFWGCAGLFFLAAVASQKLWTPVGLAPAETAAQGRRSVSEGTRALMTNPRWLLFLAGAFAGGMAMAATNNYLFPYLKGLGAVETTMGFALTIATVCEVPVLFFGNRLLRWLDPNQLFLVALAITGGRMLLLAAAGTVNQALLVQLLSGLTFPAMWLAGVACADEDAPPGLSATSQGFFGAVYGVGSAVGGFLGGALLATIGARGMYLVFGLIVLILGAAVAVLRTRQNVPVQSRRWQRSK